MKSTSFSLFLALALRANLQFQRLSCKKTLSLSQAQSAYEHLLVAGPELAKKKWRKL